MALNGQQKNFIKKNIRHLPVSKIAADLGVPENEILDYLKKKWSREKYEKFFVRKVAPESASSKNIASFGFSKFFQENRLILAFLVLLVIVVYANAFGNGFVSDDIAGFLKNENIGNFSNVTGNAMHFSLPNFLQFIAYHIGGLHPFTFRIINIFAHLGVVIMIFLILSLLARKNTAIIAASLFAVHPILTESVTWISGGIYAMYAFFFLLSFFFYLLSKKQPRYLYYSIAFYVLALLSSEKALALFLVFPLYEIAFGNLKINWKKTLPYFAASIFILTLLATQIGTRVESVQSQTYQTSEGWYNPLIQIPVAVGSYLGLIFWPQKLSLYQTEMAFSQGQYILFLLITLTFLGSIVWSYFKNKKIFFWLVFFIVALLPTLTPFKISWIVAERYVYLGTLGIIVVVAMLFSRLINLNENAKMVGYFALILIVASLSVRTIIRNRDWKSEDTLWLATAKVAPSGQNIHNNLGDVYARQGDMQKAIEEFQKAIEINPNYADAYHNLANTYQQIGELDLAKENYEKALSINPNLWQSCQNLASIAFNQGDFAKAEEYIEKALQIDPQNPQLQENLKVIQAKSAE